MKNTVLSTTKNKTVNIYLKKKDRNCLKKKNYSIMWNSIDYIHFPLGRMSNFSSISFLFKVHTFPFSSAYRQVAPSVQ